jgi:hypothetical protein
MMDHIVYVDAKEEEMQRLLDGSTRMLVRGATGRKLPHGRVHPGDRLYFIQNNGSGQVEARTDVTMVFNSDKMSEEESRETVHGNQDQLQLTPRQFNRWAGKRYLVLIGLGDVVPVQPFTIDRSAYGNMDDWLPVEDVERIRVWKAVPER